MAATSRGVRRRSAAGNWRISPIRPAYRLLASAQPGQQLRGVGARSAWAADRGLIASLFAAQLVLATHSPRAFPFAVELVHVTADQILGSRQLLSYLASKLVN